MSGSVLLPPLDPFLGAHVVFVSLPREQVIFFKVLLESYEGIAAYRTQDPEHEPGRALVAVLVPPDFAAEAAAVLASTIESAGVEIRPASREDLRTLYSSLEVEDSEPGR